MDAPMAALERRDVKGLYQAAARGEMSNVVGVDIDFERPTASDLVISSATDDPDVPSLARKVLCQAGLV